MDALRGEATELLRALLRVDTSNPPGRETPAACLLRDYLEANGVACELVARDPDRAAAITRSLDRLTGECLSSAYVTASAAATTSR